MGLIDLIKQKVLLQIFDCDDTFFDNYIEKKYKDYNNINNDINDLLSSLKNNINNKVDHDNLSNTNKLSTSKSDKSIKKNKAINDSKSISKPGSRKNSIEKKENTIEDQFLNEITKNIVSDKNKKNVNYFYNKIYTKNNELNEEFSLIRKGVCMKLYSMLKSAVRIYIINN